MQTVYKVCQLMYCAIVQMCVKIFLTLFMSTSISFLPMKCVHKCVDELHKISCYSYYILLTQQRPKGASKYFELGRQPMSFQLEILVCYHLLPII